MTFWSRGRALNTQIMSDSRMFSDWVAQDYVESVRKAIRYHPTVLDELRLQMIHRMRLKYIWRRSAGMARDQFQR
jgi:hypothetical protein